MPSIPRRLTVFITAAVVLAAAACSDDSGDKKDSSPSSTSAAVANLDLQAHRGGRGEYTEESLKAFEAALRLGVTTLELDIVLTKDKQPLVWHDPSIQAEKCSDTAAATPGDPQFPYVGKLVNSLTLQQIKTLKCDKKLEKFTSAKPVTDNRIATLPELFDLVGQLKAGAVAFNIETKIEGEKRSESATPEEFVDAIMLTLPDAQARLGQKPNIVIQSFDWRSLPLVTKADPTIKTVALWDETTWKPKSPWIGTVDYDAVKGDAIVGAKQIGAAILSPSYSYPYGGTTKDPGFRLYADSTFVKRAHDAGLKVIPWTINDEDVMNAQIDAGADGVITDYPTRLRDLMKKRGMILPKAY